MKGKFLNYLRIHKKDFVLEVGDKFELVGGLMKDMIYRPKGHRNQHLTNTYDDLWSRSKSIQVPRKYWDAVKAAANIEKEEDHWIVTEVTPNFKVPTAGFELYYLGIGIRGFNFKSVEVKTNTAKQVMLIDEMHGRKKYAKSDFDRVLASSRWGSDLLSHIDTFGFLFTDFEKYDEYKDILHAKFEEYHNGRLKEAIKLFFQYGDIIEKEGMRTDPTLNELLEPAFEHLNREKQKKK